MPTQLREPFRTVASVARAWSYPYWHGWVLADLYGLRYFIIGANSTASWHYIYLRNVHMVGLWSLSDEILCHTPYVQHNINFGWFVLFWLLP